MVIDFLVNNLIGPVPITLISIIALPALVFVIFRSVLFIILCWKCGTWPGEKSVRWGDSDNNVIVTVCNIFVTFDDTWTIKILGQNIKRCIISLVSEANPETIVIDVCVTAILIGLIIIWKLAIILALFFIVLVYMGRFLTNRIERRKDFLSTLKG